MALQCEEKNKLINSNTPHPMDEFDDLHGTVYGELGFRGATRLHHNGFFFSSSHPGERHAGLARLF
jgi:hypothetical protein